MLLLLMKVFMIFLDVTFLLCIGCNSKVLDGIHAHDDAMTTDCTCEHAMEAILGQGLLQADIKLS